MDAVQWWRSRYGGDAQIDSYEQRIVFTFFKNAHQAKYYLEYKDNSTIQKTNEIDLLTGGPQLEPTCTTVDCSDCICVHPDNYISCSTNDTMLSIWIGSDNVEINRTSTSEYTAYNFSIRRQHHMSIVRCFVVSSKYNAVFNASATLYVLGPPIAAHTPSRDETSIQTYSVIGTVSAVACFAGMALFILFKRRKETMVRTRNTRSRVEEIRISGIEQSEPMVDDHSCDHEYDEIEDNLQLSETSHQNTNPKTPYYLTPIPTTVELSPVATRLSRTMSTSENSSRMGATQITNSTGYDDLLISERDSPAKYTALKQSTAISHQKHYANE
ncbi:uncharacterized protein LOC127873679 isoform X2 [Dreissena polymorpha]|uniref:Uncharacterized protein n=1 Tax=Dreissena polymorpha TaxID=45954 RepID=A0A9D4KZB0_DREPO|nr:uncharacterized protein LOC127873679 isoform X2 [Dreissena polymorpha]KAH3847661.1 hypothetical protein DPMN_089991 [Dreissena polymorpha]